MILNKTNFNTNIINDIYNYFYILGKNNANEIHNGSIIHYLKINPNIKQYIEELQQKYFNNESLISIVMLLFEFYHKELCLNCKHCR